MKAPTSIYELRITLQEILPLIWRRIQVPSTLPLCCVHDVLQAVMGWTNSHLHQFEKDGQYWGVPGDYEEGDIDITDERRTKISAILRAEGDSLLYIYDLGDDWRHEVVLERILPAPGTTVPPVCLAGERHCPPEDVGGPTGYQEFLEVIFDPHHEEYEHNVSWAGGPLALTEGTERFQPEEFDVKAVNATLSRMRWPAPRRK